MKGTPITHEFVELMPSSLSQGTLYISIPYETAVHLCACGCGIKVVTPISPPEWHLTWDGDTVSLYPSVGNWQFPCRSHYWIRRNRIIWAGDMTKREIAEARIRDSQQLEDYFSAAPVEPPEPAAAELLPDIGSTEPVETPPSATSKRRGIRRRFRRLGFER